jgi:hypothetical protein
MEKENKCAVMQSQFMVPQFEQEANNKEND